MRAILYLIRKEFLQMARDKKMFFIIFAAPVFQLIIMGYAANLDIRNIKTVVCDLDQTETSREFIARFKNSGYFNIIGYVPKIENVDRCLDHGEAAMALVIPQKFGDKIGSRKPAQIQILVDGSQASLTGAGLQYATVIVTTYSQDAAAQFLPRLLDSGLKMPNLNAEIRVWYNPDLKSKNFMIPGVLALLLMIMTMMLTSLGIVREREMGTMEQLIVTPIRPYQLIIGKLAPFVIIGMIDVILVLIVATFWFGVPVKGNLFLLFGLCTVFLLSTLGLGILVSTVSKTQQQAMLSSQFFVMLPMMYLSGFVFPIENMPRIIQYVTYLLPLRYFIVIIRGLFLKGVGMNELWPQALILLIIGLIILYVSILRFHKKLG